MKIKDGFVLEQVGDSYLAVAVGDRADSFSGLVRMNGTGAFLWNCLADADLTHDELVDKVVATYDVSREVVLADVIAFENTLLENGILE